MEITKIASQEAKNLLIDSTCALRAVANANYGGRLGPAWRKIRRVSEALLASEDKLYNVLDEMNLILDGDHTASYEMYREAIDDNLNDFSLALRIRKLKKEVQSFSGFSFPVILKALGPRWEFNASPVVRAKKFLLQNRKPMVVLFKKHIAYYDGDSLYDTWDSTKDGKAKIYSYFTERK